MKKINLLFSLLVLTFYSCNDNEVVPNGNESYNKRHYSHINHGKIHNDFMSFINNDFIISKDITTKSDAYSSVSFFLKEKAMLHQDIDQEEKTLLCNAFDENIFLLEIENVQAIIKNEATRICELLRYILRKLVQYSSTNYYFRFLWAGFTRLPVACSALRHACTYFCMAYECVICLSRPRLVRQ